MGNMECGKSWAWSEVKRTGQECTTLPSPQSIFLPANGILGFHEISILAHLSRRPRHWYLGQTNGIFRLEEIHSSNTPRRPGKLSLRLWSTSLSEITQLPMGWILRFPTAAASFSSYVASVACSSSF
jgi:hypothetical protein